MVGHDAGVSAVCWAIHLLTAHAGERAAIEAEIVAAVNGAATAGIDNDLTALAGDTAAATDETLVAIASDARVRARILPRLNRACKEALRLFPPAALYGRRARACPQSNQLLLAPFLAHRDTAVWGDDADTFRPDRFSAGALTAPQKRSYLPFGAGARSCLGIVVGQESVAVAVAAVLHAVHLVANANASVDVTANAAAIGSDVDVLKVTPTYNHASGIGPYIAAVINSHLAMHGGAAHLPDVACAFKGLVVRPTSSNFVVVPRTASQ
jgi:cytochrome P450